MNFLLIWLVYFLKVFEYSQWFREQNERRVRTFVLFGELAKRVKATTGPYSCFNVLKGGKKPQRITGSQNFQDLLCIYIHRFRHNTRGRVSS